MDRPIRKQNRLKDFDYSRTGVYFITVCTHRKQCMFWENVGASTARPPLTEQGNLVDAAINEIPRKYQAVRVDHYVIMPNHIHLLLSINADENGRALPAPTISHVVQQMKGAVTKQLGRSIWQKGFYEHIVRGERDYREIWEYIDKNPSKWLDDEYCN